MIYHIRHGERSDLAAKTEEDLSKIKSKSDPHLTEEGKRQALETGKYFKSLMETPEFENKKICIITSPYYRCLQTTDKIIEGLGTDHLYNKTMYVEYAFQEWWSNLCNNEECAKENLIFKNLTPEFKQELFSRASFTTNHFFSENDIWSNMIYPESYHLMMTRTILAIDHVGWLALQPEHQDKIFLVVSHGTYAFALDAMLNQTLKMASYCAIACMKVKANERRA